MARTGEAAGSSSAAAKGKGKQPTQQYKRRKYIGQDDDTDEEMEQQQDAPRLDPADKPEWKTGPLNAQPSIWQPTLFHEQIKNLQDRAGAFICEREVKEREFGPFGVVDRFKALGWEALLHCYDQETKYLFLDEIEEWMATLRCGRYDKPSQMKLIGTVNGVDVEMSYDTLRRLAKYDSLPTKEYKNPSINDLIIAPEKHPRWTEMLESLFLPGKYHGTLYRKNLKIEPKLLLAIIIFNVLPRRADPMQVRYPEIPILYSLMNGGPKFSIRYLILNHVWMCRNSSERSIIPYCRIITGLLMQQGALTADDVSKRKKRYKVFELAKMGIGWVYSESERYHKLKSGGQRWRVLKRDARALLPGEVDEPESDNEEQPPSDDDDYEEIPTGGHMNIGQGSSSGVHGGGGYYDFTERAYVEGWAYGGTMQQVIESQRPPASVFDSWSGPERSMFDHQTMMSASMERTMKAGFDRQEMWNRAHAYSHEVEINNRFIDDQNRRMNDDWHAGRPVVANPQPVDYSSLPPYDGSMSYPTPPLHHSQWVDPMQQQQQAPGQGGSDSGAFGFGEWNDLLTSVFGPPQPRYY